MTVRKLTISQLRDEFEELAENCYFTLQRDIGTGYYTNLGTWHFWCGYWECARKNGIITGEDATLENKTS